MKNLILLLFVFGIFSCETPPSTLSDGAKEALKGKSTYDKIPWVSINDLDYLMKKKPRKVIIDAYTVWCRPCKMMDEITFQDPEMADYISQNFYAVKFDAQGDQVVSVNGKEYSNPNFMEARRGKRNSNHELSSSMGIRSFPTLVIMNPEFQVVDNIIGFKKPEQLKSLLEKYLK